MLSDEQLIKLMINEPSWEDVIVKIVAEEGMDPWNIDIVKLADTFLTYLDKMGQLDLRTPARFILITAILLRMKSDVLMTKKQKIVIPETEAKENELLRVLAQIPPLQPPLKRMPLANVTMDELIRALRKAFETEERREYKKERIRKLVQRAMPAEEEDITKRIDRLYEEINGALKEIEDNVEFSRLVKRWERKEIVKSLIPLLHLSQEGKVNVEQRELFKEIFVKRRKKDGTGESGNRNTGNEKPESASRKEDERSDED